jgi:hypothetical protein
MALSFRTTQWVAIFVCTAVPRRAVAVLLMAERWLERDGLSASASS